MNDCVITTEVANPTGITLEITSRGKGCCERDVLISVIKEIEEQGITVIRENSEQIINVDKEMIVQGHISPGSFFIIDCENATTEHNYIIEGGGS